MFQSSAHALWFFNEIDEPVNCTLRLHKAGESKTFYEVGFENVKPKGKCKLKLTSKKTNRFIHAQEALLEAREELPKTREEFSQVREDWRNAREEFLNAANSHETHEKRKILLEKERVFLRKKQILSEMEESLNTEESSLEGIIRITEYCGNSDNAESERPVIYEQNIRLKTGMDLIYWNTLAFGRFVKEDDQYTFILSPTPNQ